MTAKTKGFSEKDKKLLIGFLLFSEVFLGYFLIVDPALSALRRRETELNTLKSNLAVADQLFAAKASQDNTASGALPSLFPAAPDQAAILLQGRMSDLAEDSGNELQAIETTVKDGDRRSCALTLSGGYESLSAFLDQLETPPFLMGVKKIRLGSVQDGSDTLEAKIDLDFILKAASASIP